MLKIKILILICLFAGKAAAFSDSSKQFRHVNVSFLPTSYLDGKHWKEFKLKYSFNKKYIPSLYVGIGFNNRHTNKGYAGFSPGAVYFENRYQYLGVCEKIYSKNNFSWDISLFIMKHNYLSTAVTYEYKEPATSYFMQRGSYSGFTTGFEYSFFNRFAVGMGFRFLVTKSIKQEIQNSANLNTYDPNINRELIPFHSIDGKSGFKDYIYLSLSLKL
ncbi:MAG: hypothetical protein H7321_06115 [Bacteroidia bacterium]|nr:hypothetical protein [Bacteroidia bacterium]